MEEKPGPIIELDHREDEQPVKGDLSKPAFKIKGKKKREFPLYPKVEGAEPEAAPVKEDVKTGENQKVMYNFRKIAEENQLKAVELKPEQKEEKKEEKMVVEKKEMITITEEKKTVITDQIIAPKKEEKTNSVMEETDPFAKFDNYDPLAKYKVQRAGETSLVPLKQDAAPQPKSIEEKIKKLEEPVRVAKKLEEKNEEVNILDFLETIKDDKKMSEPVVEVRKEVKKEEKSVKRNALADLEELEID